MAKGKKTHQESKEFSTPSRLILAGGIIIVLLHLWAAFYPAPENWGFHFYALFDTPFLIVSLVLIMMFLLPSTQSNIIQGLERFSEKCSRLPLVVLVTIFIGVVLFAGTLLAPPLHLLGDGAILLRSLSASEWGPNIMQSFNNQPLMYVLFRSALNSGIIDSPAHTYDLYIWIDRLGAALFIVTTVWLVRTLRVSLVDKVLMGLLLFFGAGSQFFFGYVENYVLQYVLTCAYVATGWFALEKRISILIPISCFVILVGLHLGNVVFAPSLLLLWYGYFKRSKLRSTIILGVLSVLGFSAVYVMGYLPSLLRHFSSESVDFLHPFSAGGGNFPYAMFSLDHLIDWLNLNLLVVPFGLILLVVLAGKFLSREALTNPVFLFLASATACGLFFTWVTNTALGMARDWDLLSGFLVPMAILSIYLLSQSAELQPRKYTLGITVFVSFLHWSSWIGVNANADRHLHRAELLNSPRLLSLTSRLFYDESLANYFYDSGRYRDAQKYYELYIAIDGNNPRIIANISDTYRKIGEKEKYFSMLKRAVELHSKDPGVYSNLGVEYASRADTSHAIEYNEKAISIDPTQEKAHANLGILYLSKKDYQLSMQHFRKAIDLGMREPVVYRYAAEVSFFLKDYKSAAQYYDVYLTANPTDQKARAFRDQAKILISPSAAQ